MSRTEPTDLVERGRRVLALEAAAIRGVAERLGPPFAAAVRLLAAARGRVIVSGVGKSGLIARKIAATLTSTGTPASFLHPVDSLHGDLGITLLEVKGFRREDFAAFHPDGLLPRKLLLRVADVMLTRDVPTLLPDRPMRECVVLLAEKRGTVAIVDAAGGLVGVVTAG